MVEFHLLELNLVVSMLDAATVLAVVAASCNKSYGINCNVNLDRLVMCEKFGDDL